MLKEFIKSITAFKKVVKDEPQGVDYFWVIKLKAMFIALFVVTYIYSLLNNEHILLIELKKTKRTEAVEEY